MKIAFVPAAVPRRSRAAAGADRAFSARDRRRRGDPRAAPAHVRARRHALIRDGDGIPSSDTTIDDGQDLTTILGKIQRLDVDLPPP